MSTTFILGLDRRPAELFRGMDKESAFICELLHGRLGFSAFRLATPDSAVWTANKPGAIANVRYTNERMVDAFREFTSISGRLFIGFTVDKEVPWELSVETIFSTVNQILLQTHDDAAFCYEFDHVFLRRVGGETFIEADTRNFLGRDAERHLRQLDPTGLAQRGFKPDPSGA